MQVARIGVRRLASVRFASSSSSATIDADGIPSAVKGFPSYDAQQDPQLAGLNYPKLPRVSRQERPAKGWWDNQERTDFGEPVQENDEVLSMWAPDVHSVKPTWAVTQLAMMFGAIGLFSGFVWLTLADKPVQQKGYPHNGIEKALAGFPAHKEEDNVVED